MLFRSNTALFALVTLSFVTVSAECVFSDDCVVNQVCCNYECVNGASCVGQSCSSNSDCSSSESCCNSKCKDGSDYLGSSCSTDSDCGDGETCCHGTCQYSYKKCPIGSAATVGIIIGAIVVSIIFACLISLCILSCRRLIAAIQSHLSHLRQFPASYQQGYPYYPLPQYEQPQETTNVHQPDNPGAMTASEQSPPYCAEPQEGSGGVYASKPSYGAIPTAPPHPV